MPRHARDAEPLSKILLFLEHNLDQDDYLEAEKMIRALAESDGSDESGEMPEIRAQDSKLAYDHRSTNPGRIVADRERAIAEVERVVGRHTVLACDSAASVFRTALTAMNVRVAPGIADAALSDIFEAHATARNSHSARPAPMNMKVLRAVGADRIRVL